MELKICAFSPEEKEINYEFIDFKELDVNYTFLNPLTPIKSKNSQSKKYQFGVFIDGNFFWYFNAQPVANSRVKMREIWAKINAIPLEKEDAVRFVAKSCNF